MLGATPVTPSLLRVSYYWAQGADAAAKARLVRDLACVAVCFVTNTFVLISWPVSCP